MTFEFVFFLILVAIPIKGKRAIRKMEIWNFVYLWNSVYQMNWNFVYQNASHRGYRNFVYLSNFWPQGVQKFSLPLKNCLPKNTEISSTSQFSKKYTKSQCFGRQKFSDLVDGNSVPLVDNCSVNMP